MDTSPTLRAIVLTVALFGVLQATDAAAANPPEWTQPQQPFAIFGNTYYVGTRGLSAILITSPTGAVLIDTGVLESAAGVASNITALGVPLQNVKLIVTSHVHFDHAGGVAELQRRTGATVAALPWSARVLASGRSDRADPQYASAAPPQRVANVRTVDDGEVLHAGGVTITAHHTGGHTPGGTTWTWRSCDEARCVDFVYADSISAVSDDGFRFSDNKTYPGAVDDFRKAFDFLRTTSCDILLTPHPEASDFWGRIARRDAGARDALIDRSQCGHLADRGEAQLRKRLDTERRLAGSYPPAAQE
jgi:metallo-beta-lactamase class B